MEWITGFFTQKEGDLKIVDGLENEDKLKNEYDVKMKKTSFKRLCQAGAYTTLVVLVYLTYLFSQDLSLIKRIIPLQFFFCFRMFSPPV